MPRRPPAPSSFATRRSVARRLTVIAIVTCALGRGALHAQGAPADAPLLADRPGISVSPSVQPRGTLQLEGGWHAERARAQRTQHWGEALVRTGLTERVELRVVLDSWEMTDTPDGHREGLRDAAIGAKVALLDAAAHAAHRWLPQAALVVGTTLPTGHHSVAHVPASPSALVAATWALPRGTALTVNAGGASRADAAGARAATWATSASLAAPVHARVGAFAEVAQAWTPASHATTRTVDAGVALLPVRGVQVDAWLAVPMARHAGHDAAVGVGVVRRF